MHAGQNCKTKRTVYPPADCSADRKVPVSPVSLRCWWALQDLNLGPMDYESTALTAELRARVFMARLTSYRTTALPITAVLKRNRTRAPARTPASKQTESSADC
jgi:hypothetical protein